MKKAVILICIGIAIDVGGMAFMNRNILFGITIFIGGFIIGWGIAMLLDKCHVKEE